ncbi:MAG: phage tail tip lysozyme [Lachnospiraceae bacterium]|nr:phage tail tip lysozyme [Lachnospiraceae bacterium]
MKKMFLSIVIAAIMLQLTVITASAEEPASLSPDSMDSVSEMVCDRTETEFMNHTIQTINGFGEFDIQSNYIYISAVNKPKEDKLISQMPETLEVYLDDSSEAVSIPVSWYCVGDNYDTDVYYYQFSPRWDSELYTLNQTIDLLTEAPYIGVFVTENSPLQTYRLSNGTYGDGVTGIANETKIFEYLVKEKGINVAAACGILVNLYAESSFLPDNLQNVYEKKLGYTDKTYTEAVDSGTYTNFTGDSAGYGLCQWTSSARKKNLLEFAQGRGTSIADLEMQLDFMMQELKSYSTVYKKITSAEETADGAYDVAYYFCYYYEVPANKETYAVARGNLARDTYWEYYKEFIDYKVIEPGDPIADTDFTGLVEYNNELYYAKNGVWDSAYAGFAENESGWWYCENGKVNFDKTEVIKGTVNGEIAWWNVSGGKVVFTDTVAKNANGWWCIQNGKVNFSFTGFAKNSSGWWYCKNGKVDFNKTEVIKGTVNGETAWWNVSGGKVVFTDTVAKNANGWFCIQSGKVNFSFTGVAKNSNGWWYCVNGKVNFSKTEVIKGTVNGETAWWNISGGKVVFTDTVAKNANGWWCIQNGKVNFSFTGFAKNSNGWWYCVNGKVNFNASGVFKGTVNGTTDWWYTKGGQADLSFTGIGSNSNGNWYCVNGKVAWSFTGTVTFNGRKWKVVKGAATLI